MKLFGGGVEVSGVKNYVVVDKETGRAKVAINPQTGEKDFKRVVLPVAAVDGTGQLLPMFSSLMPRGEMQAQAMERPATKVGRMALQAKQIPLEVKPIKVVTDFTGPHLHLGPHRND